MYQILHSLCENAAAYGLLALNIVEKKNLSISERWETPAQNSNPTLPVVKHCLSQVFVLIEYIGQTSLSESNFPVVARGDELPLS